jgi:L-serine dehydratase
MPKPITIRLLDLFRIGPGPSSSHTVGPMRAAGLFRRHCLERSIVPARLQVELRGSLSATGHGHGTDRAVLAGLCGWEPETCDTQALLTLPDHLAKDPRIRWGQGSVTLHPQDVLFGPRGGLEARLLPHPNTLCCRAFDRSGGPLLEQTWCSIGGGFVRPAEAPPIDFLAPPPSPPVIPFHDAASLVLAANGNGGGPGDVVLANERVWQTRPGELEEGLDRIWAAFKDCIDRGLSRTGPLPGGLGVRRRAAELFRRVREGAIDPAYTAIATAQAYAYAVAEENASGGRVVTAPTNGAAGIVPGALVEMAERRSLSREEIHRALATAGAIAMVIKTHASLSGAEVGCQGEVGSATAMAAAALCEIWGGTPNQIEYAAEIAIEHNLGLTCDPLKGLVQVPCIERNAMAVAKAWAAAQLAFASDGRHVISLDRVIHTMKRTGEDMRQEYKETGEGGLAVSLAEC